MSNNPWSVAISDEEKAVNRKCTREHRAHWVVVMRNGNASAFNGYHWTPSDYSLIRCAEPSCQRVPWRTKAAYVSELPDAGVVRVRNSSDGKTQLARGGS